MTDQTQGEHPSQRAAIVWILVAGGMVASVMALTDPGPRRVLTGCLMLLISVLAWFSFQAQQRVQVVMRVASVALLPVVFFLTALPASDQPQTGPQPATVGEYASIISRNIGTLEKEIQDVNDDCRFGGFPGKDAQPGVCGDELKWLSEDADHLMYALSSEREPAINEHVIGPPPTEIAALIAETSDRAIDLAKANDVALAQNCADVRRDLHCTDLIAQVEISIDGFADSLRAWEPYL